MVKQIIESQIALSLSLSLSLSFRECRTVIGDVDHPKHLLSTTIVPTQVDGGAA